MKLSQCFLTKNDCYKAGKKIVPKGVCVHSTGAKNPMLRRYVGPDDGQLGVNQNGNHWNVPNLKVCVHAFIGLLDDGTVATYQTLPWNWRGWHAGGAANNTHISFEICEDGLTDPVYFASVYKEAVELTAYLCKLYKLDPMADGVVICHSEGHARGIASGHADVMHWFPKHGKTMVTFRQDVAATMKGEKDMSEPEIRKIAREEVAALTIIYRDFKDVPAWGKSTVEKLMKRGAINGTGEGIDLPYETLRLLVINDRMGVYGT